MPKRPAFHLTKSEIDERTLAAQLKINGGMRVYQACASVGISTASFYRRVRQAKMGDYAAAITKD